MNNKQLLEILSQLMAELTISVKEEVNELTENRKKNKSKALHQKQITETISKITVAISKINSLRLDEESYNEEELKADIKIIENFIARKLEERKDG